MNVAIIINTSINNNFIKDVTNLSLKASHSKMIGFGETEREMEERREREKLLSQHLSPNKIQLGITMWHLLLEKLPLVLSAGDFLFP